MLQIQHIRKEYRTGKLVQKALDDVREIMNLWPSWAPAVQERPHF